MSITKGNTLIEVLIAAAVATVGLLAIVQISTRSVNNSTSAKQRSEATAIATRAMECVKNNKATRTWTQFSGNVGNGCTCGTVGIYSCTISSTASRVVTPAAGAARASRMITVTVQVTWGSDTVKQISDFYLY